jgi:hypothetical protein
MLELPSLKVIACPDEPITKPGATAGHSRDGLNRAMDKVLANRALGKQMFPEHEKLG